MIFFEKLNEILNYFNQSQYHHIIFFILLILLSYFLMRITKIDLFLYTWLLKLKSNFNILNTTDTIKPNEKIDLKVNEAEELINFLDKIIKTKFNFYFINDILPFYQAGEKIDKPTLKEIQEKFYIDVSALLNKDFKKLYKKYFTTQGIEIYINEKFIYYLNKFDSLNTEEKITDTTIHKLLK